MKAHPQPPASGSIVAPFAEFLERASGFYAATTPDGTVLQVSRSALALLRAHGERIVGRPIWEADWFRDDPDQQARLRKVVARAAAGETVDTEVRFHAPDESLGWCEATYHPVADASGSITHLLVEAHDVTERRFAEDEARRNELELRTIVNSMAGFIGVTDAEGRITRLNRTSYEAAGLRREDGIGRIAWELPIFLSIPGEPEKLRDMFMAAAAGRKSEGENRFHAPDGSIVHVDATTSPVLDEDGRVFRIVHDARDVTERVFAAERLARSEARYRALFEESQDGVFVATADGSVVDLNGAAEAILGRTRSDSLGASLEDLLGDASVAETILAAALERRDPGELSLLRREATGAVREIAITIAPVRAPEDGTALVQGVLRDHTERRRLERELARSQRLESMGRVAAGVAHEINNPLTWVLANVDEAASALGEVGGKELPREHAADLARSLRDAIEGTRRIASIVGKIRLLGRAGEETAVATDVDPVLREAEAITRGETHDRARVVLASADGGGPRVRIGEGRLLEVVVNLLLNAAKAIPRGEPTRNEIGITTATAGNVVRIEVADTGCEIARENLEHLFEPFFSTRDAGDGAGLGLWVSDRIVREAGGRIEVESAPGKGSRFTVSLPAAENRTAGKPDGSAGAEPDLDERHEGTRVLVVDDEEMLRSLVERILGREHEVETAEGAPQALALLDGDGDFDLILCDLVMPGIDGVGFFREIEQRRPELARRLVFMTGGVCSNRARAFLEEREIPFLQKPFRGQELLEFVRDRLERLADPAGGENP